MHRWVKKNEYNAYNYIGSTDIRSASVVRHDI